MPVAPKNRSYLEDFQIIHPGVNWFLHAILRWKDYLLARTVREYRGIVPNTMQCTAVACHADSTPRVSRSVSAHVVNDVGLCIAVYDTLMAWSYNRCISLAIGRRSPMATGCKKWECVSTEGTRFCRMSLSRRLSPPEMMEQVPFLLSLPSFSSILFSRVV